MTDARDTSACFRIHKECVKGGQLACIRRLWFALPEFLYDEFPGCHTAGHVAIQYGNTEVLELLLRNGLNIKLGRLALIHFAVMEGNLAAVKALLNHDPSLIHKRVCRQDGFTLIQTLPFMKQKAGSEDKWNQQLRDMTSYLLERGVVLDAEAGNYAVVDLYWNQSDFEDGEEYDGEKLTALQIALNYARYLIAPTDAHRAQVFTALHAAEVFISMGADWRRQLPSDPSQRGILGLCFKRTVVLYEDVNSEEPGLFNRAGLELCDETEMSLYRETRRAWGPVLKAIVENAALPQDEMAWLTHRCGNDGSWTYEAVGRLLLSTGIKPPSQDVEKWEDLCLRRDEEGLYEDGTRSDWAFLMPDTVADEVATE